ncbi:hypothetical protein QT381_02525 [Galbitalea sp. SE-J8]|uniref:hypothetical protein n=1 Tax=Galbitalea sp. SE-J8 TaxID=3054952 RepID=UPI00259D1AEC|nr:hypothetical protein [Galbitalea sp. SE-J8]MDM4761878.1 hypothetical protein [Galbitalea sp. SE-J8]
MSPQFLASIPTSTLRGHSLTVSIDDYTYPLVIESGSWSVTGGQDIRRKADLTVRVPNSSLRQAVADGGVAATWDVIGTEGAIFDLGSGFDWGSQSEIVTVLSGQAAPVGEQQPDGTFKVTINDFGAALSAMSFEVPLVQAASMTRKAAIEQIISMVFPGITIENTMTDTGTLHTQQLWSGSPREALKALLSDAKAEGFFVPGRAFRIRDLPTLTDAPVWTIATGDGGTVKSYGRTRPLDKLYNRVRVVPGTTDGTQPFSYGSATIADPAHPRWPGRFGIGVRSAPDVTSTTAATREEADEIALAILTSKYAGTSETLELGALANPALEAGDVVRVDLAASAMAFSQHYTHLLEQFTVDLRTHDMTAQTRSTADDDS